MTRKKTEDELGAGGLSPKGGRGGVKQAPRSDDDLTGRVIVRVRPLTEEELSEEGWSVERGAQALALELDSGLLLYASRDEEGNGPGVLFGCVLRGRNKGKRVGYMIVQPRF